MENNEFEKVYDSDTHRESAQKQLRNIQKMSRRVIAVESKIADLENRTMQEDCELFRSFLWDDDHKLMPEEIVEAMHRAMRRLTRE